MGSLFGKWATSCVVHQPVVELGLAGTINARRTAGGVGTSPTEKPVCLTGSGDRPLLGPVGAAEVSRLRVKEPSSGNTSELIFEVG